MIDHRFASPDDILIKSLFCGKCGRTPFCLFPNPLLAHPSLLLFHLALSLRLNASGLFFGSPLLPGSRICKRIDNLLCHLYSLA